MLPVVAGAGFALVALATQWLVPYRGYAFVHGSVFTLDTWLHDHAWVAAFLCLIAIWIAASHGPRAAAFSAVPVALLAVASRVLPLIVTVGLGITGRLTNGTTPDVARTSELITLALISILAWGWSRRVLGRAATATPTRRGRWRVYSLWTAAALAAVILVRLMTPCTSVECRTAAFLEGAGPDAAAAALAFAQESPVITSDIGAVQSLALRQGTSSHDSVWLDYSARLFLDVHGTRGTGTLDLELAGDHERAIDHRQGTWNALGRTVPLDTAGAPDPWVARTSVHEAQDAEIRAARARGDCLAVLEIIERNEKTEREGWSLGFDLEETSLWQAECEERLGRHADAARSYSDHAFFISPTPFQEEPADVDTARRAQQYLTKAISLDPQSSNMPAWQQRLRIAQLQEQRAQRPEDQAICGALQVALAERGQVYRDVCRAP